MRILHLTATDERRGAEVFAVELASALSAIGHLNEVVALASSDADEKVGPVAVARRPFTPGGARDLRRIAARHDVVIGHGSRGLSGALLSTLLTHRPFVYRSIGDPRAWAGVSATRRLRVGAQLRAAAAVVALWPAAASYLSHAMRVPAGRIEVIPNAVHAGRIAPVDPSRRRAARRELGVSGRVVAVVGSLTEEKRPHLAIAAALEAGATTLVAGGGPLAPALRAQFADPSVCFLGTIIDVASVLHASDVLVLTSRTEGLPGVLIEAGLAGIPQVATDVGGVEELVGVNTGRLVPAAADVHQVASAIMQVFANAHELGQNSRRLMLESFTIGPISLRWHHLLQRVRDAS